SRTTSSRPSASRTRRRFSTSTRHRAGGRATWSSTATPRKSSRTLGRSTPRNTSAASSAERLCQQPVGLAPILQPVGQGCLHGVEGAKLDAFGKQKLDVTLKELLQEKEAVMELMGA